METLYVQKLHQDACVPQRQTKDSAGYDLHSYADYVIPPNSKQLIDTGVAFTVPPGTYGRIAPRSGLSCKGTDVGAGVVDRDYTGEVKVLLFNLNTDKEITIKKDDRIAQLILTKISCCDVVEVESLESTSRGEGGFGSTGG